MSEYADHFKALYAADPDPWNYGTSGYEAAKYAATLAALTRQRYRHGIEVGCSIGVLTSLLAARCDSLTGIDLSETAIAAARQRLAGWKHVSVSVATIPQDWPTGCYDLIVLSEILYFLNGPEILSLAGHVARDLAADGECVIVSWLGPTETRHSGPEASAMFLEAFGQHRPVTVTDHAGSDQFQHQTVRFLKESA